MRLGDLPWKAVQWEIAARVLKLGNNVILDWGFWSRAERDDYRARSFALGAKVQLRFLDVSHEILLQRLHERNSAPPPDTFPVSEAHLKEWSRWFKPLTSDELL